MVHVSTLIQPPAVLMRRAVGLLLCGFLLGPLTGCTLFQSVCSTKWMEGAFSGEAEPPIDHVIVRWDNNIRTAQNPLTHTSVIPGMIGRVYLLSDETTQACEAHGTIVVGMLDMTPVTSGKPPVPIAEWMFDSETLKQLKKKDPVGVGYTLFLPWEGYRPEIMKVKLLVKYVTQKGATHLADPSLVSLQTGDQSLMTMHEAVGPTLERQFEPQVPTPNKLPPGATQPIQYAPVQPKLAPPPQVSPTLPQTKAVSVPPVQQQQQQPEAPYQPIVMQSQVQTPPTVPQTGNQVQYVPITERQLPAGSLVLPPPGTTIKYLPPPPN